MERAIGCDGGWYLVTNRRTGVRYGFAVLF
jgi:hypothetical protein